MGGLARRASYFKAFKHRSNLEVPTILVDAGNLFSDDRFSADRLPAEVMTKNKWVVKGYNEFRYAAANISFNDLAYASELLKKDGYEERVKEHPFIKRLVSANIRPFDESRHAPKPYVITELTLKRGAPDKKLRIAFFGLTDYGQVGPTTYAGYRIEDPMVAAKRIMPELKEKADIIVALAYMPMVMAQQLATENPEIHTIIGARRTDLMGEPQHFNNATITYASIETKFLGELRFYFKADGTIGSQKNRYVPMDDAIPDDREAQRIVTDASTEIMNEKSKAEAASPVSFNFKAAPYHFAEISSGLIGRYAFKSARTG